MNTQAGAGPVLPGLFSIDQAALLAGSCSVCGSLHFPQRTLCPECQSSEVEPKAMTGAGTIYTHTIVRMAPPGYLGETPYAIGVVELAEPLRVSATLLADDLKQLAIGDPVEFTLIELGDEEPVLSFAYRRVER